MNHINKSVNGSQKSYDSGNNGSTKANSRGNGCAAGHGKGNGSIQEGQGLFSGVDKEQLIALVQLIADLIAELSQDPRLKRK